MRVLGPGPGLVLVLTTEKADMKAFKYSSSVLLTFQSQCQTVWRPEEKQASRVKRWTGVMGETVDMNDAVQHQ